MIDIAGDLPRHATKKHALRKLSDIKRIVIHTTDWDTDPLTIAKYDIGPNHISKDGCPAITYADIVMKNGLIYHTLPYEEVSWHVGVWNPGSLAIALMYRCTDKDGKDTLAPTQEAITALVSHVALLCLDMNLTPDCVVGHRELLHTGFDIFNGSKRLRKTCPGMQIDLDELRKKIAFRMQMELKMKSFYLGVLDGIFGKKSKEALQKYQEWKAK